jgi:dTDP-4-dehydrorhamnose 3,5-epimerase
VLFEACPIPGARIIKPTPHTDFRGHFMRTWCVDEFAQAGSSFVPVQANMVRSLVRGTVRGMHYQVAPALEAKLVRCTQGAIFDVVVDLRLHSPTYRHWFGIELNAQDAWMVLVPEGCAHGCQSLVDNTDVHYMATARFAADSCRGVRFDDLAIGVRWPLSATAVSEGDRQWPLLSD